MNEALIITAIQNAFPNSVVRAKETSGGWIVEVIYNNAQIIGLEQFRRQIENTLEAIPNPDPPLLVWKLYVYATEIQRYLQQGTLHTIDESNDDDGNRIVTVSGNDAFLDIPEFDAEFISFNDYRGIEIPAIESIGENGAAIMSFNPNIAYLWLEAVGGHYGVAGVQLANRDTNRRRVLTIRLN